MDELVEDCLSGQYVQFSLCWLPIWRFAFREWYVIFWKTMRLVYEQYDTVFSLGFFVGGVLWKYIISRFSIYTFLFHSTSFEKKNQVINRRYKMYFEQTFWKLCITNTMSRFECTSAKSVHVWLACRNLCNIFTNAHMCTQRNS